MSIVEKRLLSHEADFAQSDGEMSGTTDICLALVIALVVYVLGSAVFQQDVVQGAPGRAAAAEMSFYGP
jgi:hypothetical protein